MPVKLSIKMERIDFFLDKKSYQKARFRKYHNELKMNRNLQKGGLVLLTFLLGVFCLGLFIKSLIFQYFLFAVGILFLGFMILAILGNYSTWKDGERSFDKTFSRNNELFFSYSLRFFTYGTDLINRQYSWESIESMFVIPNLNMVILEDRDHDQFYLKLSIGQLEKLKLITSQLARL